MPTFNWVDILFIATVIVLVFNGFRNGAVVSLINLLTIPLGIGVVLVFGQQFTLFLASHGLPGTPIIAYILLFFGTVFIVHIIATTMRGVLHRIPVVGFGDELLGAVIGFLEAWLLWVVLLAVLGAFLGGLQDNINKASQIVPGIGIKVDQFKQWHDFYNDAVTHSLFAQVNGFIIKALPNLRTVIPKH